MIDPPDLPGDPASVKDRRRTLGEMLRHEWKLSKKEVEHFKLELRVTSEAMREEKSSRKAVAAAIAGTLALTGGGVYLGSTIARVDPVPAQPGVAPALTTAPTAPPASGTPASQGKTGPGPVECSTEPPVTNGPSVPTATSSATPSAVRGKPQPLTTPEVKPRSPSTPPTATSSPKPAAMPTSVSPDPEPDSEAPGLVGQIMAWPLRVLGLRG